MRFTSAYLSSLHLGSPSFVQLSMFLSMQLYGGIANHRNKKAGVFLEHVSVLRNVTECFPLAATCGIPVSVMKMDLFEAFFSAIQ